MAQGLLVLRLIFGIVMAAHGAQKLFGWFGGYGLTGTGGYLESIGFRPGRFFAFAAGASEFAGGLLIAIGLFTRPAAFLASGTMAVAYTQFHWKLQMGGHQWLPLVNKGEPAVIYCFVFFFIAMHGAGPLALDRRR